jgi:hypothetical protein
MACCRKRDRTAYQASVVGYRIVRDQSAGMDAGHFATGRVRPPSRPRKNHHCLDCCDAHSTSEGVINVISSRSRHFRFSPDSLTYRGAAATNRESRDERSGASPPTSPSCRGCCAGRTIAGRPLCAARNRPYVRPRASPRPAGGLAGFPAAVSDTSLDRWKFARGISDVKMVKAPPPFVTRQPRAHAAP